MFLKVVWLAFLRYVSVATAGMCLSAPNAGAIGVLPRVEEGWGLWAVGVLEITYENSSSELCCQCMFME